MRLQEMFRTTIVCVLLGLCTGPAFAEWPQFRGQNSSGLAKGSPPVEVGPGKNELWSLPLDSGHSSPCVAGDAIFLTTYNRKEKVLAVVCVGRADGKIRWRREVPTEQIAIAHTEQELLKG